MRACLLVLALLGAAASAAPPAPDLPANAAVPKLQGFDAKTRIPDRYIVVLSESLPWQQKADEKRILSGDPAADAASAADWHARVAADGKTLHSLARELAASHHGQILAEINGVTHAFVVTMSEQDVRALADDPRIDHVTADMVVHLQ